MERIDISEMEKIYKEQELGKYKIGFGKKPALIVIDFQYGLTDPQYNFGGGCVPFAVKSTAKLLKYVRLKKIPIFYSIAVYRKDFKDGLYFVKKVRGLEKLIPGSRNVEIDKLGIAHK